MVAGGEQSGYGILTVREQLWMFSQFYGLAAKDGWRRVDELDRRGRDGRRAPAAGQHAQHRPASEDELRRGLLNDPWILFLDEPTLGLDVAAARSVRELVVAWKEAVPGRTVLLTTHYMAEADELCDRIAIVDHGRILAHRHTGRAQARVQRESIFRLELDRLDGGPSAPAGSARRRLGEGRGRRRSAGRTPDGRPSTSSSTTTPRWVAWSGRSAASARTSVALRKSEPSPRGRLRRARRSRLRRRPTASTPGPDDRRHRPGHAIPDGTSHDRANRPRGRGRSERVGLRVRATPRARQEAAEWTTRQELTDRPAAVGGRAYPRVTGMFREKSWLFFEILLPFLATSAFVFVYRSLQAPPEYIGFVVLGGAMTAFWLNVIWMMASQLWWEKSQGNLELYFAAPMNIMTVLFGMALGGMVMSATRAVIDPGHRDDRLRRHVLGRPVVPADRRLPPDPGRPLRPGHDARQPLPDVGPRGVPPDPAPHRAGLLRVSGLNFPVGRLGVHRGPGDRDRSRSRSASTRCASSRSSAVDVPVGTPPPEVEALILVAMTVVFLARRALDAPELERMARREGRLSVRWQ